MKEFVSSLAPGAFADDREPSSRWKQVLSNLLKMLGILALTVVVTELIRTLHIGIQSLIAVYTLSVMIIARVTTGYAYGIASSVLATLIHDYLITAPRMAFSISSGTPITMLTMLAVTFIITTLTTEMKTQTHLAVEREHRAELLYEINQGLLAAQSADDIVALTIQYLSDHLSRGSVVYTNAPLFQNPEPVYSENADTEAFSDPTEQKRVHRLFQFGETDQEMGKEICYFPIVSKEKVLGVIGVDARERELPSGSLVFLQMLAAQVALALELQAHALERSRTRLSAEREMARSTLLRAISHDLRTPLTSILGASSAILEQKELDVETSKKLVEDIQENAQWLIRMVENVLTVTRISKGNLQIKKAPEAAEEVVSQAVAIVRKRFPDCHIHASIPQELLIVPMDATLISQVLINLLENAVKNSPSGSLILLNLRRKGDFACFEVSDSGRGIPDYLLDSLFEAHSSHSDQSVDSMRGMGIGLSICQTIVQAHDGTIEGYNQEKGGAKFSFSLPLQREGLNV